jgi:hypothetical protein
MRTRTHAKKPWWYKLAERIVPGRCREIPEAREPDQILLRQVALISRRVYLQQFASAEDHRYYHRHEGPVLCIGLWGSYVDVELKRRKMGITLILRRICAPYIRYMPADYWHHVERPRNQCSIFVVLRRQRERYYTEGGRSWPWKEHVKKQVERI